MMLAEIDGQIKMASESGNKEVARQAARGAGNDVRELASKALGRLGDCQPPTRRDCYEIEIPDVQWQMNRLGSKLPALKGLEMKLDLMHELKPELSSLANDITRITDPSDLRQAREGGRAIKRMLDAQGRQIEEEWNRKTADLWGVDEGKVISSSTQPSHDEPDVASEVKEAVKSLEPEKEKETVKVEAPAKEVKKSSESKKEAKATSKAEKEEATETGANAEAVDAASSAIKKVSGKIEEIAKTDPDKAKHLMSVAKSAAVNMAKELY